MNFAAIILVVMYVSLCAIVVGAWAFKTIDEQEKSLEAWDGMMKMNQEIYSDDVAYHRYEFAQ